MWSWASHFTIDIEEILPIISCDILMELIERQLSTD
jgi:hypothetical protein